MKYLRAVLPLVFILFSATAFAQDFRDVSWGATPEEIKDAETWVLATEGSYEDNILLSFSGEVTGLSASAYYEVDSVNGLVRAGYIFSEPHVNNNAYIDDFEKVQGILTRVYGTPTNTHENWSNDLYKDSPEDYGIAVAAGHVSFSGLWETETTSVLQLLQGDNFEINHTIIYTNLKEAPALNEQLENSEDDAF